MGRRLNQVRKAAARPASDIQNTIALLETKQLDRPLTQRSYEGGIDIWKGPEQADNMAVGWREVFSFSFTEGTRYCAGLVRTEIRKEAAITDCYAAPDSSEDPLHTSTILPVTPPFPSNSCACRASARGNRWAISGLILCC